MTGVGSPLLLYFAIAGDVGWEVVDDDVFSDIEHPRV
jgi:hypothetical protein